ncbi:DUF3604 domain-containing protein [Marinicauda algicola]|uniref:DUF3604 domain-containing protein n=1 Tax=Marinicauda algicola TaxID=2029849 RepID=A0A4S2GWZ4_9PROT|nr:DUF3604 domain-containing protein [Marinicauda algicola]TGY87272.1 DUF3604 domain-containing protein [Marinicauda algicola]
MRRVLFVSLGLVLTLVAGLALYFAGIMNGWHGRTRGPGEITGDAVPQPVIQARRAQQSDAVSAIGASGRTEIVFGDLHVHSTFSTDAFVWALPIMRGEGANPVADACDFARYCSALDFWAMTDHAEALTPARWQQSIDTVRRCEARSAGEVDVVPFIGFEWTQVAPLPEDHYGHKNVVFRSLEDEDISARPIAAAGATVRVLRDNAQAMLPPQIALLDLPNRQNYYDFTRFVQEVRETPLCDETAASGDLPPDCYELAATPGELVERLESQGLDPLIIPHGSTWGLYTPPGTSWDKQLIAEQRPGAFELIEVFSGHGNSEEYRSWRPALGDPDQPLCPEPSQSYLPTCWRAGEIIEERCLASGESAEECDARAAQARENAVRVGLAAHLTVEGETIADWLDSGQCRDCFLPAFNYNPTTSVQYGLAIGNFDDPDEIERFQWGFIGSSDTHTARPGIGYKPVARHYMTDASGAVSERIAHHLLPPDQGAPAYSIALDREELIRNIGFRNTEIERQSSFFTGGGLVAAHVEERSREGIWDALETRHVYATSGLRQLLWFDLVDEAGAVVAPMGAAADVSEDPVFRVRAVGSLKQNPGCPDYAVRGLTADRLQQLCRGECYNPGNERYRITRIEVVRIRPQIAPGEPVDLLIEDEWQVLPCDDQGTGCTVEFSDPEFVASGRDAVYYVRAIQEPSGQVNGDPLRCEYDEQGRCIAADPCLGDYRVDMEEECVASVEHRAWSSPIYLGHTESGGPVRDLE